MGARQSRRSVDITTTPKKEGVPAESVGDAAAPGDGKLERIEEADTKPTGNGLVPHTEAAEDKDKDEATEKDSEKPQEEAKAEEMKVEPSGEAPSEPAEVTTPTEDTPASPTAATSPETKETKKKDKMKKKWSFRSISFSKKDKNKPPREESPKNGDIAKEEPLAEGGEETESAATAAVAAATTTTSNSSSSSPAEEKSEVSSPTTTEAEASPAPMATEAKEEEKKPVAAAAAAAAVVEKKEEVKEEKKKAQAPATAVAADEKVEVSQAAAPGPITGQQEQLVEVSRSEPIATAIAPTPSITERKTSEDLPSQLPSSPPPTPIDPSPLQQAQQAAANATAIAEALNVPAQEAAAADAQQPIPDTLLLPSSLSSSSTTFSTEQNLPEKSSDLAAASDISLKKEQMEETKSNEGKDVEEKILDDLVMDTEEGPAPLSKETTTTVMATTDDDSIDDIPPPLPESPAPVLQEASRIASFVKTTMAEENGTFEEADVGEYPLPPPNELSSQSPASPLSSKSEEEAHSNHDFKMESVTQSLNSFDDSELALKERLAESLAADELQNAPAEVTEKPVENNVVVENGTTEIPEKAPPAIPVEVPATPTPAPAITEDVASVTKAIEEIDINEKAVAAAVNEAIENTTSNEIVADSLHQNNINE